MRARRIGQHRQVVGFQDRFISVTTYNNGAGSPKSSEVSGTLSGNDVKVLLHTDNGDDADAAFFLSAFWTVVQH